MGQEKENWYLKVCRFYNLQFGWTWNFDSIGLKNFCDLKLWNLEKLSSFWETESPEVSKIERFGNLEIWKFEDLTAARTIFNFLEILTVSGWKILVIRNFESWKNLEIFEKLNVLKVRRIQSSKIERFGNLEIWKFNSCSNNFQFSWNFNNFRLKNFCDLKFWILKKFRSLEVLKVRRIQSSKIKRFGNLEIWKFGDLTIARTIFNFLEILTISDWKILVNWNFESWKNL